MNKTKLTYYPSRLLQAVGMLLLFIFINFTVIVPCLNLSGNSVNLTEMVEEELEEQEEHKKSLHELMIQSFYLIGEVPNISNQIEIKLTEKPEVITPPPQLG